MIREKSAGRIFDKKRFLSVLFVFSCLFLLSSCVSRKGEEDIYRNGEREEAMEKAILSGSREKVKKVLSGGKKVVLSRKNIPFTILAAAYGKKEILELLLANGYDPDAKDERGNTSLHVAAGKGEAEKVALLLKYGAKINEAGYYARTPLMESCRCGSRKSFDLLLKHGAETQARDELGRTPLMYACMGAKDEKEMVKALMAKGVNTEVVSNDGRMAVIYAAEKGHTQSAIALLEKYADFSADGEFAIGLAAMKGAIKGNDKILAEYLLKKKLPLNWNGHIVRKILSRTNSSGFYRLMARNELLDIRRAPLLVAAKENNLEMVKFLLDRGADILQEDEKGYDACSLATDRSVISCLKKAKKSALARQKSVRKRTPLFQGKILGN